MEDDLQKRFDAEENSLGLNDSMAYFRNSQSSLSFYQDDEKEEIAPRLHFSILPRQHYDTTRPRYESSRPAIAAVQAFAGGFLPRLRGCSGGFESVSSHQRLFVGTDWYIDGWIKHPVNSRHGSPNLDEFTVKLKAFLSSLNDFLVEEGIVGPYCLMLSLDHLQQVHPRASDDSVGDARPRHFESLDDETIVTEFADQLRSALCG